MDFDAPFDETVVFELPEEAEAQRLWLRLLPARLAWMHRRGDTHCVSAVLRAEPGDLAVLLRELEDWLSERDVSGVMFELDGRTYSLRRRQRATLVRTFD
ncbi:MAG TPA: hypothetical protein VHS03_06965 [Gaiellaceae bacterium]|jgi:hypothetical protein|nr:hypothetical protein [Gaiellaceae bacterium]